MPAYEHKLTKCTVLYADSMQLQNHFFCFHLHTQLLDQDGRNKNKMPAARNALHGSFWTPSLSHSASQK
jgi:hypothetical protein